MEQAKPVTSPTQQEWENLFEVQPREVLVLIAGGSSGAAKSNGFWENIVHFLAYVDWLFAFEGVGVVGGVGRVVAG